MIISYPKDKTITSKGTLVVKGVVNPNIKEIRVGQETTQPADDGSFVLPVNLEKTGKNTLDLVAVDESGKEIKSSVRVLRVDETEDLSDATWAKREMTEVMTLGIVDKQEDSYHPKDYMTRAVFAKALAVVRGLPVRERLGQSPAADVSPATPMASYIKAVIDAGYMSLPANRQFKPTGFISRKDAVVAIVKMEGLDITKANISLPFKDVPAGASYAPYLAVALSRGLVQRAESFRPNAPLDRATAAVMLVRTKYARQKLNNLYNWKKGYGEQFYDEGSTDEMDELYVEGKIVTFDNDNQNLKIVSPRDESVVYDEMVQLKGLYKGSAITVNGVSVKVNNKGIFWADIKLNLGKNYILVEAGKEKKAIRVLRIKSFKDLKKDEANFGYNFFSQFNTFGSQDLEKDKILRRLEMKALIAKLERKEIDALSVKDEEVTWQEALQEINLYTGLKKNDKTLVNGKGDYQADKNITRGDFLQLLLKSSKFKAIIDNYRNYDTYNNEKYKPDNIRSRTKILELNRYSSDDQVAFNFSNERSQANSNYQFSSSYGDNFIEGSSGIQRTGDSILEGGKKALKIFSPKQNFVTSEKNIKIIGFSKGNSVTKVNDLPVALDKQSRFNKQIGLSLGKNTIKITNNEDIIYLQGVRLATYNDIRNLPERRAIEYMATLGYFGQGNNFNPNQKITRSEFVSLLVRLTGKKFSQVLTAPYPDVPEGSQAAAAINFLKENNVFEDMTNFRPNDNITQADAAKWFKKVSRANISVDANKVLNKVDVVRWLARDSRIKNQISKLRS